ncbi:tyrosine-type recombinase/integrase [Christiangramia forsetii]|uniref:Phage integrase family protein n=2 Tax=Christiangramia forsetii TaxID=411153 RepID=A0LY05_CHRFK|nr:tyrosine-type recombinase/integrase [Christiangramia forsetii]GGG35333.1 transposase [Christiangramia forsetii]CAL65250.1 phage integrase family protein [Christiangramia forsetii KT0803]
MASIKFLLQSKSSNAPVYARLSLGRGKVYKRKTGLYINPSLWSKATGFPKTKSSDGRELKSDLKSLESKLLNKLNEDNSSGIEINGDWLSFNIDLHFKRVVSNESNSDYLVDAIDSYLNGANLRDNNKGGKGLSRSRIQGLKRCKTIIEEFSGRKKYKVVEVNLAFAKKFKTWMHNDQKYALSYTLKMIDNIKSICYDAETNGVKISPQLKKIKAGKVKKEEIVYLSFDELEVLKKVDLNSEALDNARRWLILGCNIGQRGGDLLQLTEGNVRTVQGRMVIELIQTKGEKHVLVPLNYDAKEILKEGFPRAITPQKFNEHVKEVCRIAEFNDIIYTGVPKMVLVSKTSKKKVKRLVYDHYEKWETIASHVCRRSFATNYHDQMPLPFMMSITGHSSEKTYLKYVGKTSSDYINSIASVFEKQRESQVNKQANLKVVRNKAVNQ